METGEGFGEESLLQNGYRNATIRMLTPCTLLTLNKDNFQKLIQSGLVAEITAEEALSRIKDNTVNC